MPPETENDTASGSLKSPLDVFHRWLDGQPAEVQSEICAWLHMLLVRGDHVHDHDYVRAIREWNTVSDHDSPFVIGRAVTIRAIIEHQFGSYFTLDYWRLAKYTSRQLAERLSKGSHEHLASKHITSEQDMPRKRKMWRDVGISWGKFVVECFNDERLEEWFSAHMEDIDGALKPQAKT